VLAQSRIDQVSLDCIHSKVPVELLRLPEGKDVPLGAIDVASDTIESPEEVASVIRNAMKHVDPRRLTASAWSAR
jgi:5-methyltetrahydropteroyltriglutamate--homocysteine methyltransferase